MLFWKYQAFQMWLSAEPTSVRVGECKWGVPSAYWCKYLVNGVWGLSRLIFKTDHSGVVSSRQSVDFQSLRSQSPKMTPRVSVLCFSKWKMISDSSSADVCSASAGFCEETVTQWICYVSPEQNCGKPHMKVIQHIKDIKKVKNIPVGIVS